MKPKKKNDSEMNILPDEMEGKNSVFSLQLNSSVDQYGVTGTASTNQDVIMHCSVPLWQFISMKLLKLILFPADEPEVFKSKRKKVREKERASFNFNQNGLNVKWNDPQNFLNFSSFQFTRDYIASNANKNHPPTTGKNCNFLYQVLI